VYRNLIVMAHSVVVIPLVLLIFRVHVGWNVVAAVPAVALLALNGAWLSLLLGMLSARYRDIPPIVAAFVQVIFFITPIFWPPEAVGHWGWLLLLNPLFAAVDVIRAPLIGRELAPHSWLILLIVTAMGWAITFALFARFRPRIAYWI